MPTVTPEDIERADEVVAKIDEAPAEPGGDPSITSNETVARDQIALGIAGAREDATTEPTDCGKVEEDLAACEQRWEANQPKVRAWNQLMSLIHAGLMEYMQVLAAHQAAQEAQAKQAEASKDVAEAVKPTRKKK